MEEIYFKLFSDAVTNSVYRALNDLMIVNNAF
jgi:hypothetical protein